MMGDVVRQEKEQARREELPTPTIRMIFDVPENLDRHRYNIPAANEVAVVFVGEDDDVPATIALSIHHKTRGFQHIRDIDGCCDPMSYPLLFPRGRIPARERGRGLHRENLIQTSWPYENPSIHYITLENFCNSLLWMRT
ncbi:hypothetical protein ANCCAN_04457 [Ancylostoma caninum]|uniref:Uncharacterized protein n=1 Tax=Ancylostoma caninum TaxID=29170 RepID=A0A368GYT5_ANCCA|nr:hypothetical protein ANCCAN_04457 [Ancylostoma caninum]